MGDDRSDAATANAASEAIPGRGKVLLIGAGPGDPELLTRKAARLLGEADVVVHDRLIGPGILDLAPPAARRIDVGKTCGRPSMTQEQINRLLVNLARPGTKVVRLKGGDPFVFGRGGEETLYLLARGIEVEVVPGITAALGCGARARVPLTHRGLATSVRLVTGHCRAGWWLDLDWNSLAARDTTLVFYMGLSHVREIAMRLIAAGLAAKTPVLAIAAGTLPTERQVRSVLDELETAVHTAGLVSPVTFIIGPVVDVLHEVEVASLADYERVRHA